MLQKDVNWYRNNRVKCKLVMGGRFVWSVRFNPMTEVHTKLNVHKVIFKLTKTGDGVSPYDQFNFLTLTVILYILHRVLTCTENGHQSLFRAITLNLLHKHSIIHREAMTDVMDDESEYISVSSRITNKNNSFLTYNHVRFLGQTNSLLTIKRKIKVNSLT